MNRSKDKGDRFERALVHAYRDLGFVHAERTRAGWDDDRGDLLLAPGLCVQAKDCRDKRWGPWLADLDVQKVHAGADVAWLAVKRAGISDPRLALAVMTVERHALLLRAAGYGQPLGVMGA